MDRDRHEVLKTGRVAIYARFSSANQSEASIDDQVRRCREFVERAGGVVEADCIFTDYAISGASLQRSGFEALMKAVESRPRLVDAIVCEDVSRVTRDLGDWGALYKRLEFCGVPLFAAQDGASTADPQAKLALNVKALFADHYLTDLSDKTRRGMRGCALRGQVTGLLPHGYRSVKAPDGAFTIEIDDEEKAVVLRIFTRFAQGRSYGVIAGELNREGVVPPRGNGRRRLAGWTASGVRAVLFNPRYCGDWAWNERRWIKVPGTNRRVSRKRPESEVIRWHDERLRIVDEELWNAVVQRLRNHADRYGGPRKTLRGRPTPHLLSGLLECDVCGSVMTLHGGSGGRRYYRCDAASKRGTCDNRRSVLESLIRERFLGALRECLETPEVLEHVRKRLVARLAERERSASVALTQRRATLDELEAKLARLVLFVTETGGSRAIAEELRALEAKVDQERAALSAVQDDRRAPIRLPTFEFVREQFGLLRAHLEADALAGREALRRLLKGGRIRLVPAGTGYIARADVLPLVLMLEGTRAALETRQPPANESGAAAEWYKRSCGGAHGRPDHVRHRGDPAEVGSLRVTSHSWGDQQRALFLGKVQRLRPLGAFTNGATLASLFADQYRPTPFTGSHASGIGRPLPRTRALFTLRPRTGTA